METQYAMTANQGPGPAAFFYYNPDPNTPYGQHGYFSTHPSDAQPVPHQPHFSYPHQHHPQQQQEHPQQSPQAQEEPPNATHEANGTLQTCAAAKMASNNVYAFSPTASPTPLHIKPSVILQQESSAFLSLDTQCLASDLQAFPTTPPLSTSGSTISSPPSSCGMLRTPVNGGVLRCESIEGVKEGCEGDVESEILANCDLARSHSPPLTPVFIRPPSSGGLTSHHASHGPSHEPNHGSEGLTTGATSAPSPSLSPSPSPVLTSSLTQNPPGSQSTSISPQPSGSDFCDPRQLTVESSLSPSASAPADFPPLPPLSPHRENDTSSTRVSSIAPSDSHDPCIAPDRSDHPLSGLPDFDNISDLDSEDEEFVKDVVDFAPTDNAFYLGDKRRRIEPCLPEDDDIVSQESFEDFENDDLFARSALPLPDCDDPEEDSPISMTGVMRPKKRSSGRSLGFKRGSMSESDSDALGLTVAAGDHVNSHGDATHTDSSTDQGQQQSGSGQPPPGSNAQPTNSSDTSRGGAAPVSRRGRKQSLTDDPSKTFACTLCSRRFRRQEHLKRHYRSLHTEEKPFECPDCGKKFSRSDNLAQHARIHVASSTTVTTSTSENHELHEAHSELTDATPAPTLFGEQSETERLGQVLFDLARDAVDRSTTSESSDSGSAEPSIETSPTPLPDRKRQQKKRKRETV